jgi:hypothetical protein
MAFKRIEKKESLKDVPMLSEYIEALNPKEAKKFEGSIHLVVSIVVAKSGKGYMLNFHSFCTFLFKKSNEADMLRAYMDDNRIGTPCIEIDYNDKYNFNFGIDDEVSSKIHWKTDSMGEVNITEKESLPEVGKNF